MNFFKRFIATVTAIGLIGGLPAMAISDMTPYSSASSDGYFNGATYILPSGKNDIGATVTEDLERMSSQYNINTISLYAIENFDSDGSTTNKDHLFSELARLGMKAVIRIENYQASTFRFEEKDIDYILDYYADLIAYCSTAERRDCIAYFALNMPVDDGTVQKNLGGINSADYINNQVSYAKLFVSRMRSATFDGAKMYLSVFYGWDNSYDTPAYTDCGADGYFINNYSYPVNSKSLADADTDDDKLINAETLKKGLDKFSEQYPDSPLVIEYGFHTAEYNNGEISTQTAGLVADRAAKEKALKATADFYSNYSFVRGMMYFGYNLYKQEGNPAMELDWTLYYSFYKNVEMESGKLSGKGKTVEDKSASDGKTVKLSENGDSVTFSDCTGFSQLGITYRTDGDAKLQFYVGDTLKTTLNLSKSEAYTDAFINMTLMNAGSIKFVLVTAATVYLDCMVSYDNIEAENSQKDGAERISDKKASQSACASLTTGDAITFPSIRSGSSLKICYKAASGAVLDATANGVTTRIELPAASDYTEVSVKVTIPQNGSLKLLNSGENDIRIDYVNISGISSATQEDTAEETAQASGLQTVLTIAFAVITIIAVALTVVFSVKIKKAG